MSEHNSTKGATLRDLKRAIAIAEANGLTDDDVVLLAKDSDGSEYSPMHASSDDGLYHPDSDYSGEMSWYGEYDAKDHGVDQSTWSAWYSGVKAIGGSPCLVLWPMY